VKVLKEGKAPSPARAAEGAWEGGCGRCGCRVRCDGAEAELHGSGLPGCRWEAFCRCPTRDCRSWIPLSPVEAVR
jgi:hypothetical protein